MRQVPIEQFKRNMAEEIKDLPFEVTRRDKFLFYVTKRMVQGEPLVETHGSVVNHVVEPARLAKMATGIVNNAEEAAEKLTEIINKKKSVHQDKADIPKVVTTPKKKKKGSHNVAERVAAVMVKDLLKNGTYIHPEETPWVNPLSNTVLAPKK